MRAPPRQTVSQPVDGSCAVRNPDTIGLAPTNTAPHLDKTENPSDPAGESLSDNRTMDDLILRVHGLCKYYSGVRALDDVSLDVKRGEVHAICGENGAGKSTLIKLLSGAVEPSGGDINFEGVYYAKLTPRQAMNLGIVVIYQEFSLIPYLSVAENIFYGRELQRHGIRSIARMNAEASKLCEGMGVDIDITAQVRSLGVALQQIVEIVKAVSHRSKLIIMDEPTAPLTANETRIFFQIVDRLKRSGTTIIYISHRLEEVFEVCDRVTVLCDGRYVVTRKASEITRKQLISYMVGRELADDYPAPSHKPGEVVFQVERLGNRSISEVTFALRRGEILGFGGLVGAGRTELARAIFGADRIRTGRMTLLGKPYAPSSPQGALTAGIGLIPEDRKNHGVISGFSVEDNILYSSLEKYSKLLKIDRKMGRQLALSSIKGLNIRTPSPLQLLKNLSGGNQQKVVLAKMLATDCSVLIFDEPTRGIDVGAKREIHSLMCNLADKGHSIIMISSDMPELLGMSTRIMVMSGGCIVGELQRGEFSQEHILELASRGPRAGSGRE